MERNNNIKNSDFESSIVQTVKTKQYFRVDYMILAGRLSLLTFYNQASNTITSHSINFIVTIGV